MWASATRRRGFSLIELLVVIGIIGILASLILSSVTRAKGSGLKTECLSNQAQLVKTWALYATDNNGDLVSNYRWRKRAAAAVGTTGNDRYHKSWVMGTGHPNIGGMVDKSFLLDESVAAFAPYLRKPEIYRCPTSREVIAGTEAIRSYSMNPYMGCYEERAFSRNHFKFTHLDDVTRPDHYFVFADINQKYVCLPFRVIHMDRDAWHHPRAPCTASEELFRLPTGMWNTNGGARTRPRVRRPIPIGTTVPIRPSRNPGIRIWRGSVIMQVSS